MTENKSTPDIYGFGWDDEVEEQVFELMPDGNYRFTVTDMEREWYEPRPGSKIPACNQANIELTFNWRNSSGNLRTSKLSYKLKLASSLKFLIFQFFAGIGLHKEGDGMKKFPWGEIIGKKGIARISSREGSNGRTYNDVADIYTPDKAPTRCVNDRVDDEVDIPF